MINFKMSENQNLDITHSTDAWLHAFLARLTCFFLPRNKLMQSRINNNTTVLEYFRGRFLLQPYRSET